MSYILCGNPNCNRLGTIKTSDKKNNHLSGHLLLSLASSLTQVQSCVPSLWSSDTPTSFQTEGPCTSPSVCLKLFLPSLFNAQVSLSFEYWLIYFLLREDFPSFHIPHPLSLSASYFFDSRNHNLRWFYHRAGYLVWGCL